jgi:hypothetical protein
MIIIYGVRVRNGRAKIGIGSVGFGVGRPKIGAGSCGSAPVGGKIAACLVRLYGSPTVVVWSKGMCGSRAKTAKGAGDIRGFFQGFAAVGRLRQVSQVSLAVEQRSLSVV